MPGQPGDDARSWELQLGAAPARPVRAQRIGGLAPGLASMCAVEGLADLGRDGGGLDPRRYSSRLPPGCRDGAARRLGDAGGSRREWRSPVDVPLPGDVITMRYFVRLSCRARALQLTAEEEEALGRTMAHAVVFTDDRLDPLEAALRHRGSPWKGGRSGHRERHRVCLARKARLHSSLSQYRVAFCSPVRTRASLTTRSLRSRVAVAGGAPVMVM